MTFELGSVLISSEAVVGDRQAIDVGRLTSGGYVVTWIENSSSDAPAACVRVFDENGQPVSGKIFAGAKFYSSVTTLADGSFAVAYGSVS